MEPKEKILDAAAKHYIKYGVKNITMDDLANVLGMSKKTLYEHFANKDELVHETLIYDLNSHKDHCNKICNEIGNPIDELFEIVKFSTAKLSEMNPTCLMDLKKFYPKSWNEFESFKNEFIYEKMCENISKGINLKLYRADIKVNAVSVLYILGLDAILEDSILRFKYNLNIPELLFEKIQYHIRAISTVKGVNYLEKKLNQLTNEKK